MNSRFPFEKAASARTGKKTGWPYSFDELLKTVESLGRKTDDLNTVEPELRAAFKKFLIDSRYYLAAKNFDVLLEEKSGDKFLRNDGSVSWYHEFIPIMMVLSAVRKGQRGYGLDWKDLEEAGGLEVAITTHLRHDSVEDHILCDNPHAQLQEQLEFLRQQQYALLEDIRAEGHDNYAQNGLSKVALIVKNIGMMTQQKLYDADGQPLMVNGKHAKENVVDYIARLVYSEGANPIVFMLKQADIVHNFATMFGAEKFPAERRAKRQNEKENMYGLRQSFYDDALDKWPRFRKIISLFDANMGDILYKNFRYLETVDLFYKDAPDAFRREPNDYPVTHRFTKKALQLDLPEIIHPLHIFMKRLQKSVDPAAEPEKFQRFQNFMEKVVKPSLEHFKSNFPYIFARPQSDKPGPSPIAFN